MNDNIPDFPNLSHSQAQAELAAEFDSLRSGYDTAKTYRINQWKEYAFKPYGNERNGSSKIVDSTIFNAIEWMVPTMIQPFFESSDAFKVTPESAELKSIVAAQVLRELLNYQVKRKLDFYQVMYDTIKGALIGGMSYMKVTWQDKDLVINEPVGRPVVESINPDAIYFDWTAKSFSHSHVVCHEEEWTHTQVRRMMLGKKGAMNDRVERILSSPGKSMKEGRLRDEAPNRAGYVGQTDTKPNISMSFYLRREQWTEYDFEGKGVAVPALAIFLNNELVQLIKNPYEFGRPPFVAMECVRDPFGNPASGWAAALSDIQKFRTAILRMIADNLNSQQNSFYEVDRTNVDDVTLQLLRHAPQGQRTPLPVRRPGSINPISPVPLAPQALTAWELLAVEGENRSGNTRYSQGLDSKSLNQTATGITAITQRSEMRMWELTKRMSESTITPLARMLISVNQQKLEKQDLKLQFGINLQDKATSNFAGAIGSAIEKKPGEWLTIAKEDLGGYFTVNVDIQVGADKQTKINNMLSYLQYTAPLVDQGAIPQEVLTAIAVDLAKEMGLSNIEALVGAQNSVGTGGVQIPRSLFGGAGGQAGGPGGVPQGGPQDAAPSITSQGPGIPGLG